MDYGKSPANSSSVVFVLGRAFNSGSRLAKRSPCFLAVVGFCWKSTIAKRCAARATVVLGSSLTFGYISSSTQVRAMRLCRSGGLVLRRALPFFF